MTTLVAYHEEQVRELLCSWTPEQLLEAIHNETIGATLSNEEKQELLRIGQDWMQRALGHMLLRDAIWVDLPRGKRVYDILCTMVSVGRCPLPLAAGEDVSRICGVVLLPHEVRDLVNEESNGRETQDGGTARRNPLPPSQQQERVQTRQTLQTLIQQAEGERLALACYEGPEAYYPFPSDLDTLLPPPPRPFVDPALRFKPPSGWRRTVAFFLVILGVLLLGVPLLMGHVPVQPAGFPLGLLTLGLLVGIRAGWFGYLGGGGVWLVANLPAFHYNAQTTWGLIPLLLAGLFLMALDKNVRILWHWIWFRRREK
jgi:hypothetical protein